MPKRKTFIAGLGLLSASLIPSGPALTLEAYAWPPPEHDWSGPAADASASSYADPAYDPGRILGFDFTPETCPDTQRLNQAMGGLLGGAVGGLIGSGIGKGSGKTVATISGALLGAFGGAMLGNKVAEAGETCLPEPAYDPDVLGHGPTPLFDPS